VEDYLARFPVGEDDLIHVEDGSWSGGVTLMQERNIKKDLSSKTNPGANNGDPQFLKWDPYFFNPIYEPERNSWAVITAVHNIYSCALFVSMC